MTGIAQAGAAAPCGPPGDVERETAELVRALRAFAEGARTIPVLIQTEPDPDAIGSAYAVRVLLDRSDREAPIVSLGTTRRPETRRMIQLLDLPVTQVTEDELKAFETVIAVDLEPRMLRDAGLRVAVIDHHPSPNGFDAEFYDVRPEYGATATMLTEYLRAAGVRVGERLATALLYGIRTDTALLTRGCTREDVEAYAFLQQFADLSMLSQIDRPAYPRDTLAQLGGAIARARLHDQLALLWLGAVKASRSHLMPELADFALDIEGVRWAAAAGIVDKALVVNIRHLGETEPGAGALARKASSSAGSGGGHATMARVEIPEDSLPVELEEEEGDADAATRNGDRLVEWLGDLLETIRDEA